MTFSTTTAPQLAAQAARGSLSSLGTLLRDLIGYAGNASATDLTKLAGLTATAVELNTYMVSLDITDASAEAVYYAVCPHAGSISKIWTVIDSAVLTADVTVTAAIAAVAVTTGAITITQSGSAAGDIDSCVPSAANVVTAGQAVNFTVSGGGAAGTGPRIHLVMEILR